MRVTVEGKGYWVEKCCLQAVEERTSRCLHTKMQQESVAREGKKQSLSGETFFPASGFRAKFSLTLTHTRNCRKTHVLFFIAKACKELER